MQNGGGNVVPEDDSSSTQTGVPVSSQIGSFKLVRQVVINRSSEHETVPLEHPIVGGRIPLDELEEEDTHVRSSQSRAYGALQHFEVFSSEKQFI